MLLRIATCLLLITGCLLGAARASAQVALVTSADGPIRALDRDEAEQLYLGRLSALSDGTPVRLLDLPNGEVRDNFYLKLIGKNGPQTRAYWSRMVFTGRTRPPREVADVAELHALMAHDRHLIGYLPVSALSPKLRVLLIIAD